MRTYEVIINSTCTTTFVFDAKSKADARESAAYWAESHMLFGGSPVDGDEQHTYEPSEKWTVKEVEK